MALLTLPSLSWDEARREQVGQHRFEILTRVFGSVHQKRNSLTASLMSQMGKLRLGGGGTSAQVTQQRRCCVSPGKLLPSEWPRPPSAWAPCTPRPRLRGLPAHHHARVASV